MAIPTDRQIHSRLYIGRADGLTWEDVSDYLSRVEVNLGDVSSIGTGDSGVDGRVRQMDFTLRNEGSLMPAWADTIAVDELYVVGDELAVVGDESGGGELFVNLLFGVTNEWARESFSPRDRTSSWNQFGGGYAPLLWPNREVQLQAAVTAPGIAPAAGDWVTLFHGFLGDSIQTGGPTISCSCRDLAKRLQDTYIETVRQYGSDAGVAAETAMQQILDDNLGAGAVTLYCPVSPGFMITPYQLEYKSVWDAVQEIAAQIGWFLGYRWDAVTSLYRLTLMEPPRAKNAATADFVLGYEDDFYAGELDINDADIRNAVKVVYRDAATGQRTAVTAEDAASIAEYGRRAMTIEEGDTSLIDTAAEAQILANAALSDLKDLASTTRLDMPLLPTMDVFAGITVDDPRVSSTIDFYGIESVRHTLEWGESSRFRTEVVAAGRVVGAHTRWLAMQTRPGSPGQPIGLPTTGATLQVLSGLTASAYLDEVSMAPSCYLDVTWNALTGKALGDLDHYEVRLNQNGIATYSYYQATTNRLRISPAIPNIIYDLAVRWFDRKGVVSGWSSVFPITTPRDSTAPAAPVNVAASVILKGLRIMCSPPPEADWAYTECHMSDFNGFVPSDSTRVAMGRQTSFEIADCVPGTTYYIRLRHVDTSGNASTYSAQISAVAGAAITTAGSASIVGDALVVKDGAATTRVRVGNISGSTWGSGALPAGTYGVWGDVAGVYLRGYPRILDLAYIMESVAVPTNAAGTNLTLIITGLLYDSLGSYLGPHRVLPGRTVRGVVSADCLATSFPVINGLVLRNWRTLMEARAQSNQTWFSNITGDTLYDQFRLTVTLDVYYAQALGTASSMLVNPHVLVLDVEAGPTVYAQ